ncbi:MAG: hypothetical protein JXD23_03055 [Spirochaetales bacterium]|nr:hypothetical protein [Spirochaetales bacterium]
MTYYYCIMATLETILLGNSIVKRLVADGDISMERLKKIYRTYCKMTHPDLMKKDGREFIRLTAEYEEALAHWDELSARLVGDGLSTALGESDIRRMFYASLRHYLAAGLYSPRIRIKPEVKKRNELVLREVVYWANMYRPDFIAPFLGYNKTYLRRYLEWRKRDHLAKARKLFLEGFRNTLDYEAGRSPRALRSARSYFSDCQSVLGLIAPSAAVTALSVLCAWFSNEIDSLARSRGPGKEHA